MTMLAAFALACPIAVANPQDTFVGPMPIKPEPKPEPRPESKPAPKPEARVEVRPEPAAESALVAPAPTQPVARSEAARREAAMPLASRETTIETPSASTTKTPPIQSGTGGLGLAKTALSLAAVLALILLIAGVVKKWSARVGGLAAAVGVGGKAPSGILSILGRYPLDRATTLILLKADRRVLLLSQSKTPGRLGVGLGMSTLATLCEFTSDLEVAALIAKAEAADGKTPSQRFQKALEDEGVEDYEPAKPARSTVKKQTTQEALADVLREALRASKNEAPATRPAARPVAMPASKPALSGDAASDLRAKLATMRAKAALGTGGRRTEIAA
jgi:flagellar biogenesis protein FliO